MMLSGDQTQKVNDCLSTFILNIQNLKKAGSWSSGPIVMGGRERLLLGTEVSFGVIKMFLKLDSSDACAVLQTH